MSPRPAAPPPRAWRLSRARAPSAQVPPPDPPSDLGSDDEWQLTMGSVSDVDSPATSRAARDPPAPAELGFHWDADDNEAFVEEIVDAPLPPPPAVATSPRRDAFFVSGDLESVAFDGSLSRPDSVPRLDQSAAHDEHDQDDSAHVSLIPGYRGVSTRAAASVDGAPPASASAPLLSAPTHAEAAAARAWADRPRTTASPSAPPDLHSRSAPSSAPGSPSRSHGNEGPPRLSVRTSSDSSDGSRRTATKSVSFGPPILERPPRSQSLIVADDAHAHGSPVQSLGASSAPSSARSSGSLSFQEHRGPGMRDSVREGKAVFANSHTPASKQEGVKITNGIASHRRVSATRSDDAISRKSSAHVTAVVPSASDIGVVGSDLVHEVHGTPSNDDSKTSVPRTRYRPKSSQSEGLPYPRYDSALSRQLHRSIRPLSSPHETTLNTPNYSTPTATNSDLFFMKKPNHPISGPRNWTKGFHMNPKPISKEHSFLECVVELLKGSQIMKRKNFMQATEALIWLTSDMQEVKYKICKKGSVPVAHTLRLMRVRKLKGTDRDISIDMVGEKKPLDFIFSSRERADTWLSGLSCLVPAQASVKSRNRRLEQRESYDPLRDSWSGKPLTSRHRLNEYILLGSIGRGSFGKVKLALSSGDRQFYAVKVLSKSMIRKRSRNVPLDRTGQAGHNSQLTLTDVNEIAVMKDLDHPNVMKMKGVFDDVGEDRLYIVLEFLAKGPIMSSSKLTGSESMNPQDLRGPFLDVLSGLEYLHHHNIVHRDIKPDNLLGCGDGSVKISDFGAAVLYSDDGDANSDDHNVHNSTVGTPAFTAPELCVSDNSPECPARCFAADIWSLGATLFYMMYGRAPFIARSVFEMYDAICTQELVFPERPEIPASAVALIRSMLRKSPESRATVATILRSQWVTECVEISDKVAALRSSMLRHSREKAAAKASAG